MPQLVVILVITTAIIITVACGFGFAIFLNSR